MTPSRQRALITGLIIIGLVIVGIFGLRTFAAFRKFRDHRPPHVPPAESQQIETDVDLIRDWMTIPFISITYGLPPNLLYQALEIRPNRNEEKSLKQLNEQYYPHEDGIVLEKVKAAVRLYQSSQTPPSPETAPSPIQPGSSVPP